MITQLFKPDFFITKCRLIDLNILCVAGRRAPPKNRLMASQRPYRAILSAKGGCNPNQQIRPKTMSSFILLNSYNFFSWVIHSGITQAH